VARANKRKPRAAPARDLAPPLLLNGWRIYAYPDFRERWEAIAAAAVSLRKARPDIYGSSQIAKLFSAVYRLAFREIPAEPGAPRFRQGGTLGKQHQFWRRAKFLGRFRLFFRYNSDARIIVYVWLNDESTLRKEGARTDPYHVFREMLERGRPPSDWDSLVAASSPLTAATAKNPLDD
jgi:toxin YhaV